MPCPKRRHPVRSDVDSRRDDQQADRDGGAGYNSKPPARQQGERKQESQLRFEHDDAQREAGG